MFVSPILTAGASGFFLGASLIIAIGAQNAFVLRQGLALQSLHDGERWVHEPLRLSVFIEAPVDEIDKVIAGMLEVPLVHRLLKSAGWTTSVTRYTACPPALRISSASF